MTILRFLPFPRKRESKFMNIGILLFIITIIAFTGNPVWSKANEKKEEGLGKKIYEEHCKVCHGDSGNGKTFAANVLNPPPKNFSNPVVIDTLTQEIMIFSVTKGRPGTGMMPWGSVLTQKNIESVVNYIRKAFMGK